MFKQTWEENGKTPGEACLEPNAPEDFTCITFHPDLSQFKMKKLDTDIVALFKRRAYDMAATLKDIKVYLNKVQLPVCFNQFLIQEILLQILIFSLNRR